MVERMPQRAVVVFPVRERKRPQYLFIRKVRGIGAGKWNGAGGKLEEGESSLSGAQREIKEELGIEADPEAFTLEAIVDCLNQEEDGSITRWRVYIYFLWKWRGRIRPKKDEVVEPTWFGQLPPKKELMPGDPFWMPQVFDGQHLHVTIPYGPGQTRLAGPVTIQELSRLYTYQSPRKKTRAPAPAVL